jgi:dTDP-4-dehydrorhamnose 3,5-epimerase
LPTPLGIGVDMNHQQLLPGLQIIQHLKHADSRGDFCELWKINNDNMRGAFRQLNVASSKQNVLRGMHRQNQTKLVMPVYGRIFDVALDPETGNWFGIFLDQSNALLIPPQYAHGYLVMSDTAIVQYVVDAPYNKLEEENFNWNSYGIDWPITSTPILSAKDAV